MHQISLRSAHLHADILPGVGGGLARLELELERDGVRQAVLRGLARGNESPLPGQLACFPLVPWSNRMAPDGFEFEGRVVRPAANRAGEPCPIHGHGWQQPWRVEQQSESHVVLAYDHQDDATFSYHAQLSYRLRGSTSSSALQIELEVRNDGRAPMPFGLGLHPWMERDGDVTLRAPALSAWRRGDDGLPAGEMALPADWDFAAARPLPAGLVDNVFSGWRGAAQITWPGKGITLDIASNMDYYILYAPVDGKFFCFEPVDHLINAHNLAGGPAANGLTVLAPEQSLRRYVTFTVSQQCT